MEEDQSTMMKRSQRKEKQLAQHAANTRQWQDKTEPYNACEVKKYWNDLKREKWIEACQDLYGELGRPGKEVVSFSLWEKTLLEFFFLAPHAWPDSGEIPSDPCRDLAPDVILNMQDLPCTESMYNELEEEGLKFAAEKRSGVEVVFNCMEYMMYCSRLLHDRHDIQELIVSIGVDEKERSRMAQKEAEAVLEKFKFGEGFSLQSSCVRVIKDLVLKHINGDIGMEMRFAVDALPLPKPLMNMIDPIIPQRFDTASCPMYKLVTSFARGEWLNTPLRFENILDLKKSAL